ncbi:MAG TPA: M15 family metallopeptidase, partial [Acidimicrobiales bacterium]|nr:M15 family metallopeptidase [Acidimicrobiales bacterium]
DAAALAGAADGEDAARELAEENGGDLLDFERTGDEVRVQVRVGDVDAYARARATVRAVPGAGASGPGGRAGLAPAMLAALARADGLLGEPVPIVSGLRTRAQQQALWDRRHSNPYPVARPGTSDHERGLAVDVPRDAVADLVAVAGEAGLCQPLPDSDPVHFVVCGA